MSKSVKYVSDNTRTVSYNNYKQIKFTAALINFKSISFECSAVVLYQIYTVLDWVVSGMERSCPSLPLK